MAEEDALPFPDLCFDRILLVHGLEMAENARRLLRETWRVLKDDGRLLVVAPNRRGLWAHTEHTPFGHGQPYSPGQVSRLLARHMFHVEHRDSALFTPPWGPFLRRRRDVGADGPCGVAVALRRACDRGGGEGPAIAPRRRGWWRWGGGCWRPA